MENIEKSIVISDLHIPFEDKKAVSLLFNFIEDFQPDKIFINGDLMDCWEISDFGKPLNIEARLTDEILEGRTFLIRLRNLAPEAEIIYLWGNHEFRFERYIAKNARELYGLPGLTLEEQIGTEERGIKVINGHTKENVYRYGKLLIGHFDRVNKHSGFTAKNLLEDKGMSIIQGHTHRMGASYKRDYDSQKVAWEGGCLCELNPSYCNQPNWNQGFLTIHKDKKSDYFKITPVEIIKGKIIYGDRIISG